jgi:hypothetical protein
MRFVIAAVICVFFIASMFAPPADATQVLYRTPQQLGGQSELVIRGRVESSESYWNEQHTKIFTRTRIAVDEAYKGIAPATVDIVQLGGIVGSMKVTVHGALRWRVGDEVLLFAEAYDAESYRVSGFSQGRFSVERDLKTGEAFIRTPRMEGVKLLGAPPEGEARTEARGVPLDEFVAQALGHPSTRGVTE